MWVLRGLRCSLGMRISSNTFADPEEAFWGAASLRRRSQKHFHTSRVIIVVTNDAEPNPFLIAFRISSSYIGLIVKRMEVWQQLFFCIPSSQNIFWIHVELRVHHTFHRETLYLDMFACQPLAEPLLKGLFSLFWNCSTSVYFYCLSLCPLDRIPHK